MDPERTRRESVRRNLENQAEYLVASQLDLISQLERQLRAVHKTMRQIEKLRTGKHRVGPELSDGGRSETLTALDTELLAIERIVDEQRGCCADMHRTIEAMHAKLSELRSGTSSQRPLPAPAGDVDV